MHIPYRPLPYGTYFLCGAQAEGFLLGTTFVSYFHNLDYSSASNSLYFSSPTSTMGLMKFDITNETGEVLDATGCARDGSGVLTISSSEDHYLHFDWPGCGIGDRYLNIYDVATDTLQQSINRGTSNNYYSFETDSYIVVDSTSTSGSVTRYSKSGWGSLIISPPSGYWATEYGIGTSGDEGLMWMHESVGNGRGISKFDGSSFGTVQAHPQDSTALAGRPVKYGNRVYWPTSYNSVAYAYITDLDGVYVDQVEILNGSQWQTNGDSVFALDETNAAIFLTPGSSVATIYRYDILTGNIDTCSYTKPTGWDAGYMSSCIAYADAHVYLLVEREDISGSQQVGVMKLRVYNT